MAFHSFSIIFPFLLFTVPPLHVADPYRFCNLQEDIPTHVKHSVGGSASRALYPIGWAQNLLIRNMHINFMEVDIFYG